MTTKCDRPDGVLFRAPVDAMAVTIVHHAREGWSVRFSHRHHGWEWGHCPGQTFVSVATDELPTLVDTLLDQVL